MKCSKCGSEVTGAFCKICGEPAPATPTQPDLQSDNGAPGKEQWSSTAETAAIPSLDKEPPAAPDQNLPPQGGWDQNAGQQGTWNQNGNQQNGWNQPYQQQGGWDQNQTYQQNGWNQGQGGQQWGTGQYDSQWGGNAPAYQPYGAPAPKKSKKPLIIGLVAGGVALIAVLAVVLYLVLGNSGQNSDFKTIYYHDISFGVPKDWDETDRTEEQLFLEGSDDDVEYGISIMSNNQIKKSAFVDMLNEYAERTDVELDESKIRVADDKNATRLTGSSDEESAYVDCVIFEYDDLVFALAFEVKEMDTEAKSKKLFDQILKSVKFGVKDPNPDGDDDSSSSSKPDDNSSGTSSKKPDPPISTGDIDMGKYSKVMDIFVDDDQEQITSGADYDLVKKLCPNSVIYTQSYGDGMDIYLPAVGNNAEEQATYYLSEVEKIMTALSNSEFQSEDFIIRLITEEDLLYNYYGHNMGKYIYGGKPTCFEYSGGYEEAMDAAYAANAFLQSIDKE